MRLELHKQVEEKMEKTCSVFKEELNAIRAGRANPFLLEKITVNYYGVETPLNQVSNISVPEARMIVIQPWEAKLIPEIEKEIQKSNLGINPSNDGKVIRLVFPQLSEERRIELTKSVKKLSETSKIAVRNIRRDAMESIKKMEKNSEITEDDQKNAEEELQKITDKFIEKIDEISENKEKELMEI